VIPWQLAAFGLLLAVIAAGFAWYERSRPPARVVALVAALAALAVAGRLALAPIPNVVATTDVALITGYALGGAPGFAVGALAAPVSNIWLGQGPWTPWQMAGWGLCGLGGAALAGATGRRLGRVGLATACALAGIAYGALLDLSVMVSYGGEQSLDRYLALSARGLPFNLAHAAGNFALALAAGPALVRMISRFRERLEFTWRPPRAAARAAPLILLVAGAALALGSRPAAPDAAAAEPALAAGGAADARRWLERAQNGDGGFGASPGDRSAVRMTGWAMLGLEAAGRNPLDLRARGGTPVGYLRHRASALRSAADLELAVLALAGAGESPYAFGGENLVAKIRAQRGADGSFSNQVNLTAFAVFALRSASVPRSELARSTAWLRRVQNRDGGWGSNPRIASDSDSTGAALQALAAAGERGRASARGVGYLRRAQLADGGLPLLRGGASNSQSTSWAVQGAVAAGASPASLESSGRTPLDYLAAQQAGDGHYRYSQATDQTPVWVTAQALPALARRAFPLSRVPRASEPGGLPAPRPPGQAGGSAGGGSAGEAGAGGRGAPGGEGRGEESGRGGEAHGGRGEGAGGPRAARVAAAAGIPAAAEAAEGASGDGDGSTRYLLGGLGALAAALGGGFLWYRRRLP
jgi:Squalene-hopene cyclase C-terminal domain/Prenyltransferase and squalene oxidase repeat